MNYNINQTKIDLIHNHFRSALNLSDCDENILITKKDKLRLRIEKTRLKAIIRNCSTEDKSDYEKLLQELNLKTK